MVTPTRQVLERYRTSGGHVVMEELEGSGHAPFIDAAERWAAPWFAFLVDAEPPRVCGAATAIAVPWGRAPAGGPPEREEASS